MLVHRGQRIQLHADANLVERRSVLVLLPELRDEVVDLPLPLGDRHARIIGERKAKLAVFYF